MKQINVIISSLELMSFRFPEMGVLQKLREHGIPVKGIFEYGGVESGTIEISQNFDGILVSWTDQE